QKNTTAAFGAVGNWLEIAGQTWTEIGKDGEMPSTKEFATILAERLRADVGAVGGWMQGVEELAKYAQSEATGNAIDEERESVAAALRAVRPIVEARLQKRLDTVDEELMQVKCEKCGRLSQSQGRRTRNWSSTVGEIELSRRYSWCEQCGQGRAIAQQQVGLPEGDYTASLEEISALMSATVPHHMAAELVGKLLGIEMSDNGIKGIIERRGQAVVAAQDIDAESLNPYYKNGLPTDAARPSDAVAKAPEAAYLEMDGVIVMTRGELPKDEGENVVGRGGKGRKYKVEGREVKNAVLYSASQCATESESRNCILEKHYVSHLGDYKHFALLVWATILRLRFDEAKLLVVLSDGSEWIRQLCAWLPIQALLILDLFHVKRRIWEVANAVYGDKTAEASLWAKMQCERVEQGQAQSVIEALGFLNPKRTSAGELVSALITYLSNNLDRMDYPSYRDRGLRVGSGAVESANYHVTGARLKLQGMRWSENGAAEMARLRTDLFNGKWESRTRQLLNAA
ncbi:MAG TPA: ISKra4 family transposase, partial [Nitrososphaera sp.]|nr:ISKra4 family transposase [Nitrososphaera sp.]